MVPAHFIRILELPDEERAAIDTSSLSLVVHAAAPCPVAVKQQDDGGLPPHRDPRALRGQRRRGHPNLPRRVAGPTRKRGPSVARGRDPHPRRGRGGARDRRVGASSTSGRPAAGASATATTRRRQPTAWRDDAFTVGDIGYLDEEGYLTITDRVSDMVLWGGVNIAPREIEEVLYEHPDVVDCAVFGIPDERDGEHLKAIVQLRRPVETSRARSPRPGTPGLLQGSPRLGGGRRASPGPEREGLEAPAPCRPRRVRRWSAVPPCTLPHSGALNCADRH